MQVETQTEDTGKEEMRRREMCSDLRNAKEQEK